MLGREVRFIQVSYTARDWRTEASGGDMTPTQVNPEVWRDRPPAITKTKKRYWTKKRDFLFSRSEQNHIRPS